MRHFKVIPAAQAEAAMSNAQCVTTVPRLSLDGSQAMTQWTTEQSGGLTHAEARALVHTSAWQVHDNG